MMLVHGLRLLVAIVTFVVGVGSSRLFGSESKPCGKRVHSYAPVHVAAPAPPVVSCFVKPPMQTVKRGLLNMNAISKPAPSYPAAAKAAGVQGAVTVRVEVNDDGRVAFAEAVDGPELLREAAEEAARWARFPPMRSRGEPAWVSGELVYNFTLR